MAVLVATLAALTLPGCATNTVSLRSVPKSPLVEEFDLTSYSGPKVSARTTQLLRVYNLSDELGSDFRPVLRKLQAINDREPSADIVYAMSELAFLGGKKTEAYDKRVALDLYGASVLHACDYLFDPRFAASRNPYDPNYRGACELYNGALESALRIVCANKELLPGGTKTINTASGDWDITCVLQGSRWRPEDFERFEFVSDYEFTGLKNLYLTHGLGVPLIAVRRNSQDKLANEPAAAKYYAPGLSFPVTAFLRPLSRDRPDYRPGFRAQPVRVGALRSLDHRSDRDRRPTGAAGERSDHAAGLLPLPARDEPGKPGHRRALAARRVAGEKVLRPGQPDPIMGLYMVQPYEPGKIPVLMVHGLWSTPMTWMEMFNDLRSQPEIRDHYQFWFYLYPTAQPFWLSAAQLRRDLAQVRAGRSTPTREEPALDQMVLIGHSMGGLISRLQTVPSGDEYWHLVSRTPLPQIKADPEVRQKLARRRSSSSPTRRSAAWSPSARRSTAARTPTRPPSGCWKGCSSACPADAGRQPASSCSATTQGHSPIARCCGSTRASTRWPPTRPIFPGDAGQPSASVGPVS